MDRIWQWAWDRYGARYFWALLTGAFASALPVFLVWSWIVLAFEKSTHYVEASLLAVAVTLVMAFVSVLPGSGRLRLAQHCAAGREVDREKALEDTYGWV
jgi:adenylate cyclase